MKTHLWNCWKNQNSLKTSCVSQQQAMIKLLQKPNKDKDIFLTGDLFHCNYFDLKIISKSLATTMKIFLSNLIDARKTA